jgi:quercetin dioxygenase-like cupin family protein
MLDVRNLREHKRLACMKAAIRLVLLLLAFQPTVTFSQEASTDALTASPDNFKLLLENRHVRVLEYTLQPGKRDLWHTHPPKVSYVVSGGTLQITLADGKSFLAEDPAGTATWMDAVGRHYVENVGRTVVRVVLIEVKAADDK